MRKRPWGQGEVPPLTIYSLTNVTGHKLLVLLDDKMVDFCQSGDTQVVHVLWQICRPGANTTEVSTTLCNNNLYGSKLLRQQVLVMSAGGYRALMVLCHVTGCSVRSCSSVQPQLSAALYAAREVAPLNNIRAAMCLHHDLKCWECQRRT